MALGADIGYIRVSSADQNTARQLSDIHLDKVFEDHLGAIAATGPVWMLAWGTCVRGIRSTSTA